MEKMWVSRAHALAAAIPPPKPLKSVNIPRSVNESPQVIEQPMTNEEAIQSLFDMVRSIRKDINELKQNENILEENEKTLDENIKLISNTSMGETKDKHTYRVVPFKKNDLI
jgi:TolA-binding protein